MARESIDQVYQEIRRLEALERLSNPKPSLITSNRNQCREIAKPAKTVKPKPVKVKVAALVKPKKRSLVETKCKICNKPLFQSPSRAAIYRTCKSEDCSFEARSRAQVARYNIQSRPTKKCKREGCNVQIRDDTKRNKERLYCCIGCFIDDREAKRVIQKCRDYQD